MIFSLKSALASIFTHIYHFGRRCSKGKKMLLSALKANPHGKVPKVIQATIFSFLVQRSKEEKGGKSREGDIKFPLCG